MTLVIIYHSGYSKACPVTVTTFIDEFVQFIIMNFKNTVILGDFNLHLDTDDPSAIMFAGTLDAMGLTQHVNFPTHIAVHTLDQIYSVLENSVTVLNVTQGTLIIFGQITIPRNATGMRSVTSRKLKGIICDNFMNDINLENISLNNIDDAVRMLDIELTRVLDLHAPLKTRKVTDRKKEPWYEDHVKQEKKFVRNWETVWRRHGRQPYQWKAFTVERNRLNRMLAGT